MASIKIYNVYYDNKKDYEILETQIIKPIQAGRASAERHFEGMRGDDVGENISYLNKHLNELTAIYWIWKNDKESDYIGLFHYRRHLSFRDENRYYKNPLLDQVYEEMDENYFSKTGLKDSLKIKEIVTSHEVILGYPVSINENYIRRTLPFIFSSDCGKDKKTSPLEEAYRLIEEREPSFKKVIQRHRRKKEQYIYCNFILKREIFENMCEWLFPILLQVQDFIDYSQEDCNMRTGGYVGERLIDLYLTYLVEYKKVNVFHLAKTFIINSEKSPLKKISESDFKKEKEPTMKIYIINFLRASFDIILPFKSHFKSNLRQKLRKIIYKELRK